MSAYVVIDVSRAIHPVRNYARQKTSVARSLRKTVKWALALAGGYLGKLTQGSLFVGEFPTATQAKQAIATLQRSRIAADFGIGTDVSLLKGRKSKKWLRPEPITEPLESAMWSPSLSVPKWIDADSNFQDYWVAADVLSAPLIGKLLKRQDSQMFQKLGTQVNEGQGCLSSYELDNLAAIGLDIGEKGADDHSLVFFWKRSPRFVTDTIQFRGKTLRLQNEISGEFSLQVNTRRRPFFCGSSIGRLGPNSPGGSVCCLVQRRDCPDHFFILSASHVMGEGLSSNTGSHITQPYGGGAGDIVGKVEFASVLRSLPYENHMDAAYASIDREVFVSTIGLKGPQIAGVWQARKGMDVWKIGAGRIGTHFSQVKWLVRTLAVEDSLQSRRLLYRNVWLCQPAYSESGDSGCAIIEAGTNRIVGLHVAGCGSASCFLDMQTVLKELDLTLVI